MKIIIKETGKVENLSIVDPETSVNWAQECIGNAGALEYDNASGEYVMTQADFDWWKNYLSLAEADAEELAVLKTQYGADEVQRIMDEEWKYTGNDYDEHHAINQKAFARIREELTYDR